VRIDWVTIRDFKNLRDFHIDFGESQLTTVLIGRNGSGKSNLLEALVLIFRDLDLEEVPSFPYEIQYYCHKKKIFISADPKRPKDACRSRKALVRKPPANLLLRTPVTRECTNPA
jgi:predicted ATP-dependent endonuclease of OLD family